MKQHLYRKAAESCILIYAENVKLPHPLTGNATNFSLHANVSPKQISPSAPQC